MPERSPRLRQEARRGRPICSVRGHPGVSISFERAAGGRIPPQYSTPRSAMRRRVAGCCSETGVPPLFPPSNGQPLTMHAIRRLRFRHELGQGTNQKRGDRTGRPCAMVFVQPLRIPDSRGTACRAPTRLLKRRTARGTLSLSTHVRTSSLRRLTPTPHPAIMVPACSLAGICNPDTGRPA